MAMYDEPKSRNVRIDMQLNSQAAQKGNAARQAAAQASQKTNATPRPVRSAPTTKQISRPGFTQKYITPAVSAIGGKISRPIKAAGAIAAAGGIARYASDADRQKAAYQNAGADLSGEPLPTDATLGGGVGPVIDIADDVLGGIPSAVARFGSGYMNPVKGQDDIINSKTASGMDRVYGAWKAAVDPNGARRERGLPEGPDAGFAVKLGRGTYNVANNLLNRPETSSSTLSGGGAPRLDSNPSAPAAGPGPETPAPAGSAELSGATDTHIAANSVQSNPQVSAAQPQPIPNSQYSYAGNTGGAEMLTRPTVGGDGKPVIDPGTGRAVPEFTDNYTAAGLQRPGQTPEALAYEQAMADDARQMYIDNTTGSDGRRYFGGPETEQLRAAQMAEAKKGDQSGAVSRQLAGEGLTPEQRAAYAADPSGAYQVDAQANSSAAKAQMDAFKQQYNMNRNAKTDARLNRSAAIKEMGVALEKFKDDPSYAQLSALADQAYDPSSGQSMTSTTQQLIDSIETDDSGYPVLDASGKIKFKPIDAQNQGQATESKSMASRFLDPFFG